MRWPSTVCTLWILGCSSPSQTPDVLTADRDVANAPDATVDAPVSDVPAGACNDTPDGVQITAIDTVAATATAPAVTAYHVLYPSTGGIHVHGQICVPASAGPHPIVVYNHGGFAGLGAADWSATGPGASGNQCYNLAAAGNVVVMSQYRGESDALGGALGTLTSEGSIEVCAGEVDDSLALLAIAQRRCDVAPMRVGVWGASHGGCITLQLLRRRAPGVRAGVAIVPPTDLAGLYDYHLAREPGGDGGTDSCDPVAVHQSLASVLHDAVGTPASDPAGYADRSVVPDAHDYADLPVMVLSGLDDCLVPFSQACSFQSAWTAASVTSVNYHLDASGAVTTAPVAGCAGFGPLTGGTWPGVTGFTGDRYFIALDGQGHGFTGVGATRSVEALLGFLAAHL